MHQAHICFEKVSGTNMTIEFIVLMVIVSFLFFIDSDNFDYINKKNLYSQRRDDTSCTTSQCLSRHLHCHLQDFCSFSGTKTALAQVSIRFQFHSKTKSKKGIFHVRKSIITFHFIIRAIHVSIVGNFQTFF